MADYKAKRIDAAQQLKLFDVMTKDLKGRAQAAQDIGLTETGLAIYGLLFENTTSPANEGRAAYATKDEAKVELASLLEEQLGPHVAIVDWQAKEDIQREMRRTIKRQLKVAGVTGERGEILAESVVDLMKRRRAR